MAEMRDWRLPEHRREAFQRFYSFHLKFESHPGCVYSLLRDIADYFDMDEDQRAWLTWLNGNTENAVTTLLLLEQAPTHRDWEKAVAYWNNNFKLLEWDTDRRHQKSKFGPATEKWINTVGDHPARGWLSAGLVGWDATWNYAVGQPWMGRMSAWSMLEYARILLGHDIPDADTLKLEDVSGSKSHRNSLGLLAGYEDAVYWEAGTPKQMGVVGELHNLGESLLEEAYGRNQGHPDVSRLSLESALCTWKSWHKPNRRYPNVYADMMYNRIKKGEARFGGRFDLLWDSRRKTLPPYLRLEDSPYDPGLVPVKQNHYLSTGQPIMMHHEWPDMLSDFAENVAHAEYGRRDH